MKVCKYLRKALRNVKLKAKAILCRKSYTICPKVSELSHIPEGC